MRGTKESGAIYAADEHAVVAVRVPFGEYFSALATVGFVASFLVYLEYFFSGLALAAIFLPLITILYFSDRLIFDGRRLYRTGIVFRAWSKLTAAHVGVKPAQIEKVTTIVTRAFRRGGRIYYRYRTIFKGRGCAFTAISTSKGYEDLIKAVVPRLPDEVVDAATIEIRDHYRDPATLLGEARRAGIPSADVLEQSFRFRPGKVKEKNDPPPGAQEKADGLLHLANELKVAGRLVQSLEAFRRALLLKSADAGALLDLASCLRLFAGLQKDERLERRAAALMRLAERSAAEDPVLLTRLAESYSRAGEWDRAARLFKKTTERFGGSVRTLTGLAEVALREGKLAHVVHNLSAAAELAGSGALRRRTRGEYEYFLNLNNSDEYMELEFARVNLLDTLIAVRSAALRIMVVGVPSIACALLLSEKIIADIGWAVSGLAMAVWIASGILGRLFADRIPYEGNELG